MDKELGVGKFLPGQRLERYMSVARLKTLQRNGVLACGRRDVSFEKRTQNENMSGLIRSDKLKR